MVTRLSASDASFYQLENTATPMYVGLLLILRRPRAGLSYEALLETVEQRLPQIPRYRQKVQEVKLGLARPVWIDDRDFDITYHVRRSALPSPGSDEQLHELIARLAARPLDKSRPLWEMYLVEGLEKNRIALYTKSHQALINGVTALAIRDRRPDAASTGVSGRHLGPGTGPRHHAVAAARGRGLAGAAGRTTTGRRIRGRRVGNEFRPTRRDGPQGSRYRPHGGTGHRAQ